jgi:acetylglutamate kinase
VTRFRAWDEVDAMRMVALIEEAFGRPLLADLRARPLESAYVADDYRGAAIITDTPLAPYLSKFAVTTVARGEGVGGDLWRAMTADHPRLYWRSRAGNPITAWYRDQADGLVRIAIDGAPWVVLWRGLAPAEIPAAIAYCQGAPPDFE